MAEMTDRKSLAEKINNSKCIALFDDADAQEVLSAEDHNEIVNALKDALGPQAVRSSMHVQRADGVEVYMDDGSRWLYKDAAMKRLSEPPEGGK